MPRSAIAGGLAIGALVLLAFNLRLIFPSLSVLLPEITRTTGISAATAGYVTALPMICLGVFAPIAPLCVHRFGVERTLVVALLGLAAGTALRGFHGLHGLVLGSLLAGACIAVCNVLLPVLVRRDFSGRVALVTALYVTAMNLGSAAAAALTIPLVRALDLAWSSGLALWALPVALAGALWLPRFKRLPDRRAGTYACGDVWRNRLAWQVTLYMGLQSSMAYTVLGWMAPILRERGMDPTTAGLATSACIIANLAGNLLAPAVIKRAPDQRLLSLVLALACGIPLIGLLIAPVAWVFPLSLVQGLAQGATFSTALTIIVLRSPNTETATLLSGMAQSAGYTIGALAPLLIGLIHHWSGSFISVLWLLVFVTLGTALSGWSAGRNRYVVLPGGSSPAASTPH